MKRLEGIFGKAVELDIKEKFGLDTGKRLQGYREKGWKGYREKVGGI